MKSKEQIKKDIVDQLAWDSRVDANNVLVKVEDDAVRLQEDVPTYSAMVTAENIAHREWGVSTVKNELGGLKLLRNNFIEEVFQILNPDFD